MEMTELILEGVAGIVEGMNPKMIRRKLESLAGNPVAKPAPAPTSAPAAARVQA
jgi:flagellar motor component MotA